MGDTVAMMRAIMAASRVERPRVESAIEPKMVTGHGPQGSPDGPGRGVLTLRQQRHMAFLAHLYRRDT